MTAVLPRGEIDISAFASNYEQSIKDRVAALSFVPRLAVLSDRPYDHTAEVSDLGPVARYVRALETTTGRIGISTDVRANLAHHAIAAAIGVANIDPTVHGMIVTLPFSIGDETQRARYTAEQLARISAAKDVDGLRPGGMPATSEAAFRLLESVTGGQKLSAHVNGVGHVGSGLVWLLRSHDYEVTTSDIDTTPEERRRLFGKAAVIISASGIAEGISRDDLALVGDQEKFLINIGRGRNAAGKTVGDFSPEALADAATRGWSYTNNGLGVGRLATLTVADRTVTASVKA